MCTSEVYHRVSELLRTSEEPHRIAEKRPLSSYAHDARTLRSQHDPGSTRRRVVHRQLSSIQYYDRTTGELEDPNGEGFYYIFSTYRRWTR